MVFPVGMCGCESWTIKKGEPENWCLWIIVLEKTLESALDSKKIKPVNPKRNQHWIFTGRTEAEAELKLSWSWSSNTLASCCKELTFWKRPWCWERLRTRGEGDDRMRCFWLNGHEFEETPGDGKRSSLHHLDGEGKSGVLQSMQSQRVRHGLWLNSNNNT